MRRPFSLIAAEINHHHFLVGRAFLELLKPAIEILGLGMFDVHVLVAPEQDPHRDVGIGKVSSSQSGLASQAALDNFEFLDTDFFCTGHSCRIVLLRRQAHFIKEDRHDCRIKFNS